MTSKYLILASVLLLSSAPAMAQQAWDLERCIAHAVEHNIRVKQAEQQIETQEININSTRNNRLPGVDASASQNFSFGRGLTSDNTYVNRNTMGTSFGANANVSVYDGGQTTRQLRVQKLQLAALIAELERAREDISLQVASAYLEVLFQHELVGVAQRQKALSMAQVERIASLLQEGKASPSQLADAKAQVAQDELSLTQNQNQHMLALLTLSQLLELPTPEGFDVVNPQLPPYDQAVLPLPDAIMAEAIACKPRFKASQERLRSAEQNISLARTGYFPRLSLGGGLGTNYYRTFGNANTPSFGKQMQDNFNRSIGLSLSVPIFDRFATRNRIRQAKVQYVSQQLEVDQVHKDVYKEIQQAYYNAVAAREQCASAITAGQAATTAHQLMQTRYENGKATATEYEEAKTRLARTQSDQLRAEYSFYFRCKILDFYRGIPLK